MTKFEQKMTTQTKITWPASAPRAGWRKVKLEKENFGKFKEIKHMNEYEAKLKEVAKVKVVVYIDAANLERSVKSMFVRPDEMPDDLKHLQSENLRWSVDYRKLNEFFKTVGNFQGVKFYTPEFENEGHRNFRYFLDKGLGFNIF